MTKMTFIESIKTVYKKYFTIKGRATRSEFWWFQLYWILNFIVLMALMFIVANTLGEGNIVCKGITILFNLFLLINACPLICVTIRRLHDSGKSGVAILLNLIPFGILIFFLFVIDAESDGDNKYGTVDGVEQTIEKTDVEL